MEILHAGLFLDYLREALLNNWVLVLGGTPCKEAVILLFEKSRLEVVKVVCGVYIATCFFVMRETAGSRFSLYINYKSAASYVRVILAYPVDGVGVQPVVHESLGQGDDYKEYGRGHIEIHSLRVERPS